jgi:hypothetical protein
MPSFYCKSCSPNYHKDWSSHLQNPTLNCSKNQLCGRLPLYDAIKNCAPDAVILMLLEANKGTAGEYERTGCLPLHKAIENKYSDMVILALMAVIKKAVMGSNASSYLPLHLAIKNKCSSKIVIAILQECTEASKINDPNGVLPLMMATRAWLLTLLVTETQRLGYFQLLQ